MVAACAEAGIAAMTGDGVNPDVMKYATDAIRRVEGKGIPTIKPWNIEIIREKMKQAENLWKNYARWQRWQKFHLSQKEL